MNDAHVLLPDPIRDDLLAHLGAALPNEGCGVIVGDGPAAAGGRPRRFVRTRNSLASPTRYEIDPADLVRLVVALDAADETIWAIVHSHVRAEPRPSPTDIAGAEGYPDALHLIAGPFDGGADPTTVAIRAWRIRGSEVEELELAIEG